MAMPTQQANEPARMLPLSGVAAVALVVASVAIGGNTPGSGEPAAQISAYYGSHLVREAIASFVLAASAPFFVLFATALAESLSTHARTTWNRALAVAGSVAAGAFVVTAMVHFALTRTASDHGVAGGALQALAALDENAWVAFTAGLGVLMLGAAGSMLAQRVSPVRAWVALITGVALFIPFANFIALIVSGLWIIATSILAFRRDRAPAPTAQLA